MTQHLQTNNNKLKLTRQQAQSREQSASHLDSRSVGLCNAVQRRQQLLQPQGRQVRQDRRTAAPTVGTYRQQAQQHIAPARLHSGGGKQQQPGLLKGTGSPLACPSSSLAC